MEQHPHTDISAYLDGEATSETLAAHLRMCALCVRHLQELAAVQALVAQLPMPARPYARKLHLARRGSPLLSRALLASSLILAIFAIPPTPGPRDILATRAPAPIALEKQSTPTSQHDATSRSLGAGSPNTSPSPVPDRLLVSAPPEANASSLFARTLRTPLLLTLALFALLAALYVRKRF